MIVPSLFLLMFYLPLDIKENTSSKHDDSVLVYSQTYELFIFLRKIFFCVDAVLCCMAKFLSLK